MNKKQMMVLTTTRQKARAGDPAAQLRLGRLYARGEIVEADPLTAYVWFARAAAQEPGSARDELEAISAMLSPADLEEARRRLTEPAG
jgi:TPR repeat protein